ncbi:rhamnogalacturonan acetylesterase [Adhaeribacter radiodurans]|uniref:Rhamnogalacturonan acetylesterase n=1 Tax=Adhaeribacter radiodurans TaxID=2745197 RepID=A0A7L7L2Q5_9BACT|nr:rhamnogalacturonan acetylesterase [Adhaeribacter radiodurans]QMU27076.1 rhamnogalacturonan acetylesterase [Adhaeribacter radiodurans]
MRNNKSYVLVLMALVGLAFITPPPKRQIFLIGDSTMSDKQITAYPETGWGMMFAKFVDTSNTVVYNHAQNGRSTKSFLEENRWEPIVNKLQPGDIVLIQFGHNDEVATKPQATTPRQFQKNLATYIKNAKAKKAIPVLITPAARRSFNAEGKIQDTHQLYSELIRKVAQKEQVPLIELNKKSQAVLQTFGPENSKWLYNYLKQGQHPNYPEGKVDDTHFSELGARKMAEIVFAELKTLNPGGIAGHFFKPVPKK